MKRQPPVPRRRQTGVVFYLFVVLTLLTMATLSILPAGLLSGLRANSTPPALQQARALILAQLSQPALGGAGARLGQLTRLPDLPIAAAAGEDSVEPIYDGLAEAGACAWRTWSTGQALRQPVITGAAARCFGRLPWRELGLSFPPEDDADPAGEVPWLIVSPNLAANAACLPDLNPLMLANAFTAYACPGAQPYPWLTVLDPRGNVISDRVAFALILPGPPLPGQVRTSRAAPSNWLDTITVAAGCTAPCRPGTYNNAGYGHLDNESWQLIKGPSSGTLSHDAGLYAGTVAFNDQLLFVTIDELLLVLEQRARRLTMTALQTYRTTYNYLPFAAPLNSGASVCQRSLRIGRLAVDDGDCGIGQAPDLPATVLDAGWQRYFLYSVSARCNQDSPACTAPGLTLDTRNDVDGLLISPGSAIRQAPWAVSRGTQQRPVTAGAMSANLADWLDTTENAGGTPDVFISYEQGTGPRNDRLYPID